MKKFFQHNAWLVLAVILYVAGIAVSGFSFLELKETLKSTNIPNNSDFLMIVVLSELVIGLMLMMVFYVKWQRKQAQGDIIYVDRYVSEEIQNTDAQMRILDWNKQREEISKMLKNANKNQLANDVLKYVCSQLEAVSGAFYIAQTETEPRKIELVAAYAFALPDSQTLFYEFGEGIAGQVAKVGQKTYIKNIPEGYLNVLSGLGESQPSVLLAVPIQQDNTEKEVKENPVKGVIELASFKEFSESDKEYVDKVADLVAKHL